MNWRPAANQDHLLARATLLRAVREYFDGTQALEVVTPTLSAAATTDPAIESFVTHCSDRNNSCRYLQTSPEFPMKRLLCAGSGDIYQICTVFRQGESGRHHNPEFQLLEWYRLEFDHHRLMDEVAELVSTVLQAFEMSAPVEFSRISYRNAIKQVTGFELEQLDYQQIEHILARHTVDCPLSANDPLDHWFDLLMSTVVAPSFAHNHFTFIYDYPASQAALARLRTEGESTVAERFELYYGELELANGFHELNDAAEQADRFRHEQQLRIERGHAKVPFDQNLIAALQAGLPDCAGVALGLDRLLMLATGTDNIYQLISFPDDRA